ncbi:MAG: hypothetical protein AB7G11_07485 [Phycisphaerales bacterium]
MSMKLVFSDAGTQARWVRYDYIVSALDGSDVQTDTVLANTLAQPQPLQLTSYPPLHVSEKQVAVVNGGLNQTYIVKVTAHVYSASKSCRVIDTERFIVLPGAQPAPLQAAGDHSAQHAVKSDTPGASPMRESPHADSCPEFLKLSSPHQARDNHKGGDAIAVTFFKPGEGCATEVGRTNNIQVTYNIVEEIPDSGGTLYVPKAPADVFDEWYTTDCDQSGFQLRTKATGNKRIVFMTATCSPACTIPNMTVRKTFSIVP